MNVLRGGAEVCVTVTLLDGLVLARSAFHHSMNYRSVVIFGKVSAVDDPSEKTEALRLFTEHIVKGRWADVRPPTQAELNGTTVLSLPLEEASAKVRTCSTNGRLGCGTDLPQRASFILPEAAPCSRSGGRNGSKAAAASLGGKLTLRAARLPVSFVK